MVKGFGDDTLIYSWMRNRNTLEFMGIWEELHNINFKGDEFVTFKKQAGLNSFNLTPRKWIEATGAITCGAGIWESVYNPSFNFSEFTIIKSYEL